MGWLMDWEEAIRVRALMAGRACHCIEAGRGRRPEKRPSCPISFLHLLHIATQGRDVAWLTKPCLPLGSHHSGWSRHRVRGSVQGGRFGGSNI